MVVKLVTLLCAVCVFNSDSAQTHQGSFNDAIKALRGSGSLPIYVPSGSTLSAEPSYLETEVLKKPLTVAQFSEWLNNLYFNEKQKRDSAIKSLLAHDPLRSRGSE